MVEPPFNEPRPTGWFQSMNGQGIGPRFGLMGQGIGPLAGVIGQGLGTLARFGGFGAWRRRRRPTPPLMASISSRVNSWSSPVSTSWGFFVIASSASLARASILQSQAMGGQRRHQFGTRLTHPRPGVHGQGIGPRFGFSGQGLGTLAGVHGQGKGPLARFGGLTACRRRRRPTPPLMASISSRDNTWSSPVSTAWGFFVIASSLPSRPGFTHDA